METNLNQAPVDVMAYLQALEREIPGSQQFSSRREEAKEARAAVAELIEASRHCEARLTYLAQDGVRVCYELKAIRDALARVQGEQK